VRQAEPRREDLIKQQAISPTAAGSAGLGRGRLLAWPLRATRNAQQQTGCFAVRPKHVLVVDDDPAILELIERALAAAHFRVSKARRVSVARDLLVRQRIDLVITDARIPGETGLRLAETARELGIALIVMSGDPEWAAEHGMDPEQYLAKPFELRQLLQLVYASLDAGSSLADIRPDC
jgi:DNA-binding NtrC family response regulator